MCQATIREVAKAVSKVAQKKDDVGGLRMGATNHSA